MKNIEELRNKEDIVEMYMRSLEESMLDEQEQKDFLRRIKAGDLEARDEFIERNLKLVIKEAKKYCGRGLELIDLIQEGNMGLMKAVDKFDLSYSNRFSTYATNWIRQSITRAIVDKGRTIRIPVHFNEKLNDIKNREKYLTQKNGEKPSLKQLASSLNMKEEEVEKIQSIEKMLTLKSLNSAVNPDKGELNNDIDELEDFIDNNELSLVEKIENDEMAALVNSTILKTLNEREIKIIKMRFGFDNTKPMTLEEIGKNFGVTRERIRQIEAKAIKKLQKSKNIKVLKDYSTNNND